VEQLIYRRACDGNALTREGHLEPVDRRVVGALADSEPREERRAILKQIHAAIAGDPARYHIVRAGQALPTEPAGGVAVVSGRVASKGLSDELKGVFYAVIETPAGRAYHVSLDRQAAETMRPGEIVSFTTKPDLPVRPVDRQIAEVARARGGAFIVDRAADGAAPA
jgi:hypothetical protein